MQDFRNLQVWQKSHMLTLGVYKMTALLPKDELFGLISQLRRAATSIPTNLAEGTGRGSDKDFARFIQISMGSACELEYLHLLCKDLKYVEKEVIDSQIKEIQIVKKMLVSLLKTLNI